MEEQAETLLDSLRSSGVSVLGDAAAVAAILSPEALVSICGQCLNLIDDSSRFPTSLPGSTAEDFRVCGEISSSIKAMGFSGDLSFYEFHYPSEEETDKLLRFLVERLPKSSAVGNAAAGKHDDEIHYSDSKSEQELSMETEVYEKLSTDSKELAVAPISDNRRNDGSELLNIDSVSLNDSREGSAFAYGNMTNSSDNRSSKMTNAIEDERQRRKRLVKELSERTSELVSLETELELLRAAAEIALVEDRPLDVFIEKLNGDVASKKSNLTEMEKQGDALRITLEERKISLQESLYGTKLDLRDKFQYLKEIERETGFLLSETRRREEEYNCLSAKLKKQASHEPRRSYIDRINEIAKNSRKQDADIDKIIRDTRELQLESNFIQERLHRTYAVTDETVYREAKKDQTGRQAYRLLTSIHETFEQISEKIRATDKAQRERAEHEKKLARIISRDTNIQKQQAELAAMIEENESLEKCINE